MQIITAQERALVSACCDCALPLCDAPRQECESVTATAYAEDNADSAYDDAYDAWIAGGEVGPEPEKPAGYDNWDHGTAYAPFAEPAGADTDPLPNIYRRSRTRDEYEGVEGYYQHQYTAPYPGPEGSEPGDFGEHQVATWTIGDDYPVVVTYYMAGMWWDDGAGDSGSTGSVTLQDPPSTTFNHIHSDEYTAENNDCEVTATTWVPANSAYTLNYGTPVAVPTGTPEDWPIDQPGSTWAVDMRWLVGAMTLSDGIDRAGLISNAIDKLPAEWPDPPEGSLCKATTTDTWPTIGSFKTGDPAAWPACADLPIEAAASATVTQSRYRFGVPEDYSTVSLPRSTWEMQWDEVFASAEWWEWFDDGMVGAAPDSSLSLVASRSWVWGGDMGSPWSDWHVIAPPSEPGEVRVVNVLVTCWKSARIGTVPTAVGDQIALP